MIKYLTLLLFILLSNNCYSQQLVLSNKQGLVGRTAQRITGDYYTHSAIELNGWVYESDWPRVKKTPVWAYGKPRTTNDYYQLNLSQNEINRMQAYAESRLGEPYRLRNYFFPRSRRTNGTWCSPFVGQVLNQSNSYRINNYQSFEPQNLFNTIRPTFNHRVTR
jgi:hypothetical protein